jgi:hypothetical protein
MQMRGGSAGADTGYLSQMAAEQALGKGYEVMEEELDEDYEPTSDEIEEYAKYLGMDLNFDK